MAELSPLLVALGLKKHFLVGGGLFSRQPASPVRAVDGVDLELREGETLGLVGESGCGKTTVSRLLLRLERSTAGQILFGGRDISSLSRADLQHYRRSVQAVFQDPFASLSPRMRVRDIIAEPIIAAGGMRGGEVGARVREVMSQVGLDYSTHGHLYPHEFSGGQRQRIAIARALGPKPRVVVLDEPVSALDVSVRAQVINLLSDLQRELGLTYLLISHELSVVAYLSAHVAVMYLGRVVEKGVSEAIFANPAHPYTEALLSAIPPTHPDLKSTEILLTGEIPSPRNPPGGCHFHPRCPQAEPDCAKTNPVLEEWSPGRQVACLSLTRRARFALRDTRSSRLAAAEPT